MFANVKTKTQISFAVTTKLISAYVFATQIVHALKDKKRAFLKYDKLIIEGDAYIYDQEADDILLVGK